MLEALTISITEQVNGVRLTYRLSLEKKESLFSLLTASSFIDLLKQVFTENGLILNIDGITSCTSNESGKTSVSEKA